MLKVTHGLSDERALRAYPVATIGNFDGHHLGHRALLQTVVETARKAQGKALVLTFEPHPVKILAPHIDLQFLTSPRKSWRISKRRGSMKWFSWTLLPPSQR
ncbi:riboflavin biosynthesis protein RibF [Nitrospirota bacterium]|nr:riboflavin biosynthesis protein RibF [Nitrospirota bacterium]